MNAKNLEVMTLTNNLANKKSNDNMKSFFSKYIKLIALILLSTVGVTQAWAAEFTYSIVDGVSSNLSNENITYITTSSSTSQTTTIATGTKYVWSVKTDNATSIQAISFLKVALSVFTLHTYLVPVAIVVV